MRILRVESGRGAKQESNLEYEISLFLLYISKHPIPSQTKAVMYFLPLALSL